MQTKNPVRRTWVFQFDFSKFKYRSTEVWLYEEMSKHHKILDQNDGINHKIQLFQQEGYTGGPRISWFLVPKWYHEIWGSRILKPFLALNLELGPKIF